MASVQQSKLQPSGKQDDLALRSLARRVVFRNWGSVLLTTVVFAPLLKVFFPACSVWATMSVSQTAAFLLVWFVSNDFLFTVAHTLFHEIPWLYKFSHKEHHTWKAPYVWMSHAMSLTEMGANGIGVMAFPLVHTLVMGRTTPLSLVWCVQLISQWIGCVEHSGYVRRLPGF